MMNNKFKTIGFIKEHDENFVLNEYIDDSVNFDDSALNESEKGKIINYLNEGTLVLSTPLALFDGDTYIASHMLLSDGEWIWTGHFAYYLRKLNFSQMTHEFLTHLRTKKYKNSPLSKKQKTDIDIVLGLKILNLSEKVRRNISRNAEKLGYDISKV